MEPVGFGEEIYFNHVRFASVEEFILLWSYKDADANKLLVLKWLLLFALHVSYFKLPPSAEIDQQTFIKTQK